MNPLVVCLSLLRHYTQVVLTHTFADPSFPQDTAHFLERACCELKARFNIHEPVPEDPEELPGTFRRFLEHAALFRRVVVVVDAMEAARVPPIARPGGLMVGPDGHPALSWLPPSPPLAVRFVLAVGRCKLDPIP